MDISELAKRSGLPAATLRFYEDKGLIHSIGRNGLRRVFSSKVLEQLALIALGHNAGFSLSEIADMLTANGPDIDRQQLSRKADELDLQIKQLGAMRNGLRHAAACPAPQHLDCPKFQQLLRVVAKKVIQPRRKSPATKV
ncbi:helix-turn-helix domain-containing protein [Dasania sp. GY-19]|uniref:Helix-turn-helix domain-containing protein n=1 Tax=Dasania phycosphaerae TaxID=2950436 RepID=A0A9J6RKM3_9GAMM|nr:MULTISPECIES: helix-turn-helix domain-containing protein [Dasania]MCZ0864776.1 helix-turn-helix domain-containing protein [Dasania phycosphaerae]MCZ0868504.1 helix-turn-helix domain-containing protein [Dasania phycosphaerae]